MTVHQIAVLAVVTSPLGVLLVRRRDQRPPWSFPGGTVEAGETFEAAAEREAWEEAGLMVNAHAVIGERTHPTTGRHLVYVAARPAAGLDVQLADPAALLGVRWVPFAALSKLLPDLYPPIAEYLAVVTGPQNL